MARKLELLQGTLDMLILKTLELGRRHGYSIAERIEQVSHDVLLIEEGWARLSEAIACVMRSG